MSSEEKGPRCGPAGRGRAGGGCSGGQAQEPTWKDQAQVGGTAWAEVGGDPGVGVEPEAWRGCSCGSAVLHGAGGSWPGATRAGKCFLWILRG